MHLYYRLLVVGVSIGCCCLYSCSSKNVNVELKSFSLQVLEADVFVPSRSRLETREAFITNMQAKIEASESLFVRVFVPLCDNVHQGILPVPKAIGNGQDPKSNLYWGARYGVRSVFSNAQGWGTEQMPFSDSDSVILDRVVFRKKLPSGSDLIVLAEAYDGRQMQSCLDDFFDAARGNGAAIKNFDLSGCDLANPNLVVFNGHNGIIKADVMPNQLSADRPRDVAAIACLTDESFTVQLEQMNAYPALMTLSLMAPEGYVLKALIEEWASLGTGEEIHSAVATAYNTYQKCGIRGARGVFSTGWELDDGRDYFWW